jgi:signal peptidase I
VTISGGAFPQSDAAEAEAPPVAVDADGEPHPPDSPVLSESPGKAAKPRRARGCLFELVETVVLTVLIFLGIQTFVAQPYRIEGGSMENTLLPDQYLLIDKLTPHWAPYARGDIVVLHPPEDAFGGDATPFIKRVIGLAGDTIELKDGHVYVNGAAIDEPYLFAVGGTAQPTDARVGGQTRWLVPAGEVFVMGDHRQNSSDSRVFGPIEVNQVIGRAWLRYWPVGTFGIVGGDART